MIRLRRSPGTVFPVLLGASLSQKGCNSLPHAGFAFKLTFPNSQDPPSELLKGCPGPPVAGSIPGDLEYPIRNVRFWYSCASSAFVSVPEATMDENHRSESWEHKIWLSKQVIALQGEAISETVREGSNGPFGDCVPRFNRPHDAGTHRRVFRHYEISSR
jgi:hypothetical protein